MYDSKHPATIASLDEWAAYEARCWFSAIVDRGLQLDHLDRADVLRVRALNDRLKWAMTGAAREAWEGGPAADA